MYPRISSEMVPRSFFQRNTLDVAKELLGCFLIRKIGKKIIRTRIIEVEAYIGEDDLACHASKGRTKRTEIMYGEAGHAYVYLIYGMYHCLNIVTERKDYPAAVLIRGAEVQPSHLEVGPPKLDGPGKLCRFLRIDRALNGWDVTHVPAPPVGGTVHGRQGGLWIERGERISPKRIQATKRVGVGYAKHCRHYLWRFVLGTL